MPVTHKSLGDIDQYSRGTFEYMVACNEHWSDIGGAALPKEKALRQRAKYFSSIKFSNLEEVLRRAQKEAFI